jgi:hypothetical protein
MSSYPAHGIKTETFDVQTKHIKILMPDDPSVVLYHKNEYKHSICVIGWNSINNKEYLDVNNNLRYGIRFSNLRIIIDLLFENKDIRDNLFQKIMFINKYQAGLFPKILDRVNELNIRSL